MRRLLIASLLAFGSFACDSHVTTPTTPGPFVSSAHTNASAPAPVVTSNGSVAVTPVSCAVNPASVAGLNLLLTSTALSLRLDSVTVRMIDGTSLGGRIMTFPNADLSRRFGDTLIVGGSSRPFEFMLDFGCVAATGALVDVVVLDGFGIPHVLKTSATWQ